MNTYTNTVYAYICMHMLNCSTFVVNKRATALTLYRFLPLLYVLICQWREVFLQKSDL